MRLATSFFLAWALLSLASAQEPSLKSDPALAGKISLKLKNSPLPDALPQIDKKLTWSNSIADLKVTAFVKDQPTWLVMEKVADVLGCEWKLEKDGYRLVLPPKDYSALQGYLKAEDALLQKQAKADIDELVKKTAAPLEVLQQQLKELKFDTPNGRKRRELFEAIDERKRLMGDMFRRLAPSDWNTFWRGQVLTGEAAAAKGSLRVAIQFIPEIQQVAWRSSKGPDGALMGLEYVVSDVPLLFPPESLAEQPFAKKVLAWATPKAELEVKESLKKRFGEPGEPSDPPYRQRERPIADELELLAKESGCPIIADGFRTQAGVTDSREGNLLRWISKIDRQFPSFVKIDGDWILFRHGGFWRRRLIEPPEREVRALEKIAEKRELTLDEYATFASKLTPAQAMAFRIGFLPLVRFDANPLRQAMPALRFYGSLSGTQRRIALNGDTLSASELTPSQQKLFTEAQTEGVFSNADDASWNSGLLTGGSLDQNGFAMFAGKVYPFGKPLPGGRNVNGSPGKSPEEQKVEGITFLFGLDRDRRIGYTLPVPPVQKG